MKVKLVSMTRPTDRYIQGLVQNNPKGYLDDEAEISPEDILVHIARVSSSRTDTLEDPEPLIRYLIKNNHWSPFEHTMITFEIVTSLAIATQYLRHRSFTFQQFSQRYARVTEMEEIELRQQASSNRQSSSMEIDPIVHMHADFAGFEKGTEIEASTLIQNYLEEGMLLYQHLLDVGVAKECARFILPQTTQTTLYMSGTLRSWIHLIGLREDAHAQKEAQEIAVEIKAYLIDEFPITSAALGWSHDESPNL